MSTFTLAILSDTTVQGKEVWLRFSGAAMKRYPTSKVRETQVRWYLLRDGIRGQTHWNHNQRQLANLITWITTLSNSMKLSHACGATQDRQVTVERSDGMWSTGEGNGKPLQDSCLDSDPIYLTEGNAYHHQNQPLFTRKLLENAWMWFWLSHIKGWALCRGRDVKWSLIPETTSHNGTVPPTGTIKPLK